MTTAIQKTPAQPMAAQSKPSALNLMAARLSVDPAKLLDTLKSTVFQKATNEELMALVTVANEYGLNPFLKELYAFPAKGGGIVPIVSVDGWNKMLIRQPDFDGIEFEFVDGEDGKPVSCTAIIYVKSRSKPVKVTEYFDECKRNTDPWNNMPRRMLRNRTLCQASRMAFGFSGIHNEDEAATITVESTVIPNEPPPKLVAATAPETKLTPQAEIEGLATAEGFNIEAVRTWLGEEQGLQDADSIAQFSELPADLCARMVKAKKGFITSLNQRFPKAA